MSGETSAVGDERCSPAPASPRTEAGLLAIPPDVEVERLRQAREAMERRADRAQSAVDGMITRGSIAIGLAGGALGMLLTGRTNPITYLLGVFAVAGLIAGLVAVRPYKAPSWEPDDATLISQVGSSSEQFLRMLITNLHDQAVTKVKVAEERACWILWSFVLTALGATTMAFSTLWTTTPATP